MSDTTRITFGDIVQHFSPAWFAAVMGTAVVPLAVGFATFAQKLLVGEIFFVLSLVIFIIASILFLIRLVRYPSAVLQDLRHPIAGNFFPTIPISLVLFSLNLLKFRTFLFPEAVSHQLALYLWAIGALGIYGFGFAIILLTFRHQGIDLTHANFGWYIPPVSLLIIPVAGFELAKLFPQWLEFTFGFSMISMGTGFFLFLFVGAIVYHRYVYHELLMSKFAATFFIGLAPTAILAISLFKLWHLLQAVDVMGLDPHTFEPVAKLGILFNFGLSSWWFVMGLIIIAYYIRRIDFPYALSWWAFTFPSGALAVAAGVAREVSHFQSIAIFYNISVIFLLAVWLLVIVRTSMGMISGKIFLPAH